MLTIHYKNQEIPTGKDFSVRLTWKNPCCFFEEIPGSAGLGIDIPVNDYSRAIFGNPERFEKYRTGAGTRFNDFEIRFGGALLMTGVFNITSADAEIYSGWLQSEAGSLGEEQRDRLISDLNWDPDGERVFQIKEYYDDSADDYQPYPILNGAFWNGKGRETTVTYTYQDEDGEQHKVNDTINYLTLKFRENFGRVVNKTGQSGWIDLLGIKGDGEACVVSPFLYLRKFLRMLFRINGFYIDRNDMVPSGLDLSLEKFLLLYNNFNIMGQQFATEYQEITRFDPDSHQYYEDGAAVITGVSWAVDTFRYADLVPQVALKDILLGLQNYLNYVFLFRPFRKIDVIDRNAILEGSAFDLDRYFLGTWVIGEQKDVTLKFLSDFDGEDRMFGQEYHDYSDRRADFGEPVGIRQALENIASPREGELRLVKDENKIYEYRWKVLSSEDILRRETQLDAMGWDFVSSGPQPYLYGDSDEVEEIKSCFSTLQFQSGIINIPVVLQQGNMKKMKSSFVGFTPRLINSAELLYPGALNWEGAEGLFKCRWEKWSRLWKQRLPVEGSFDLPLNVLIYVINHITQKYRTLHGEFIIDSVETEFGSNMIGTTRITGYKL
jgi:hypothetical protein